MSNLTPAEQLLYTTVKLMAFKSGQPTSTGTGFFFRFADNGSQNVPCIVTNKHVVEGAELVRVRCHFANNDQPSGHFVDCNLDLSGGTPFPHPDANVDICAIPFAGILQQAEAEAKPLFYRQLDMSIIPEDDDWAYFDALEEVLMIGCPNGISDEANNLPISRRGITATSLSKDYNGKPEFMVDMACFPGSSGSPIFLFDRNGFLDRRTNTYQIGASRLKFVGILYSGPLISNNGQIILSHLPRVQVASMMHLGHAIKSHQIKVLDQEISKLANIQSPPTAVGPVIDGK